MQNTGSLDLYRNALLIRHGYIFQFQFGRIIQIVINPQIYSLSIVCLQFCYLIRISPLNLNEFLWIEIRYSPGRVAVSILK